MKAAKVTAAIAAATWYSSFGAATAALLVQLLDIPHDHPSSNARMNFKRAFEAGRWQPDDASDIWPAGRACRANLRPLWFRCAVALLQERIDEARGLHLAPLGPPGLRLRIPG